MDGNGAGRILVVDDDPTLVRMICLILSGEGYVAVKANGGEEGLVLVVARPPPDLVVLDLQMPVIDGREFFKRARVLGFSGPVLICSAYGADVACRELGADDSIAKPFDPDELVSSVSRLLLPA